MWLERVGDQRILARAREDPELSAVLETALPEFNRILTDLGRPFRLQAMLTRDGEYLIRVEVAYRNKEERDRIWNLAAQALEKARAGRPVHVLCGISRLYSQSP